MTYYQSELDTTLNGARAYFWLVKQRRLDLLKELGLPFPNPEAYEFILTLPRLNTASLLVFAANYPEILNYAYRIREAYRCVTLLQQ